MRFCIFLVVLLSCRSNIGALPRVNLLVASSAGPAAMEIAGKVFQDFSVVVQSGASSVIARQIVSGMPCDVVILADNEWMDYLAKRGMIEEDSRKPFLGNRLAWVVNAKADRQAGKSERIAIADPNHVPVGKYAKALLSSLGLWKQISDKVLSAPDARTALLWVETGEAQSAIVYETDALSSSKVKIKQHFEEDPVNPIRYPIAKCKSTNPQASKLFDFLTKGNGIEVFRAHGFRVVMQANERI